MGRKTPDKAEKHGFFRVFYQKQEISLVFSKCERYNDAG
jgi:hypothetical protein